MNKQHRRGFWAYLLWLFLMTIAMASSVRGEDRALLIGVGRYAHFDDRLNGVGLDLEMMSEVTHLMGFEKNSVKILKHEQATSANVHQTFEDWLINGIEPQDRVLIYFSGHGSQVPDENQDEQDNFDEVLLLYDTTLSVKNGRRSLDGVLHDDRFGEMLAQIKSDNILVILDACHSGSATRSLQLVPRPISAAAFQVKYFYYSPLLESAGGSGRFDVMEPGGSSNTAGRYVAMTACRDDEKTVATSRGSIFTLGLRQALRSAAKAGQSITPEQLQQRAARFIKTQIRSESLVFHPQIAGHKTLRQRPLRLLALAGGDGTMRPYHATLEEKSAQAVRIELNKSCFEPGDVLEISVKITEPGFLNVVSTAAGRTTVLFPNRYHPHNAVEPGNLTIPSPQMDFELVSHTPTGPHWITAFLSRSPDNYYKKGLKGGNDILADLTPGSARTLRLRQRQNEVAAGSVSVDVREAGQCR